MARRELTQLRGQLLVAAHRERSANAQFSGQQPALVQPREDLSVQDLRWHIRQWFATPQAQRIRQQHRSPVRSALGSRDLGLLYENFKTVQIEPWPDKSMRYPSAQVMIGPVAAVVFNA